MIRIVVSSKALAAELAKIDFTQEFIHEAILDNSTLTLKTALTQISVIGGVAVSDLSAGYFAQYNRRWDWVYNIVSKISDQPVGLEITDRVVNLIFQF